MQLMPSRIATAVAGLLASLVLLAPAQAQQWPTRPVRFIIPLSLIHI